MKSSTAVRPSFPRALLRSAAFAASVALLSGCGGNAASPSGTAPSQPSASAPPAAASASPSAAPSASSAGTASPNASPGGGSPSAGPTTSPAASDGAPDSIPTRVARMSLQEKIGQMILAGFEGSSLPDAATLRMIREDRIGGVILYKDNIADLPKTVKLVNAIKAANAKAGNAPIFVSVDQEGGKVSRMPASYAKIPEAAAVGLTGSDKLAERMGELLARQVGSAGFNVDFTPVLDINSNPDNPVIGTRSFGATADVVTHAGLAAMRGLREEGIVSVVKHFPGHGDTSVDSHLDLPVLNKTAEQLAKLEWIPFKAAIGQQADAVMVAHILFPKIDPDAPASFSKVIIGEQLRGKLGYKGVVITDDMTMGAIAKHYDLADAAVKSVQAGSDILLVAHGYDVERKVYEALQSAVRSGKLPETRIDESVTRILALKDRYKLTDKAVPLPQLTQLNEDTAAWKSEVEKAGR
ncbi:beta-N-acetylhexosaminidase [Cohnella sp. JJ-181]|uniref:beta-N-acetylhexosaminidase n=1 Tax=Cohnella rhizoplanae TaxID=2974897 RepID=UPI0022FF8FBB|nr:beta-N-acetylhexosaminidase [Cohnella sp. JJ-181]CAI6021103.1 Beta-hexosaminidase [Cohnella sp. JJ-181]